MSLPSRRRPTVLITGASAGIGAALARVYAEHGWDLVLTARRAEPLEALADEVAGLGAATTVLTEDLADPGAPERLFRAVEQRGLQVDGLVNNAGFSRTTGFFATPMTQHAAMLQVMLTAPVELAHRFAPAMAAQGFGRILNVASLAGRMPATGGDTLYGPIKSFLIKASTGLHLELQGTGVHVTTLCPGYTLTEFHDVNGSRAEVASAYPTWMWQTAEHVARVGYAACEANRAQVVPGVVNGLLAGLAKHLPDRWAIDMISGHARRLKRL